MLNQINKSFAIYLLSGIFKHFLHTFSKQSINNFCPQDYLKVVKHRGKLTSDTFVCFIHESKSHKIRL